MIYYFFIYSFLRFLLFLCRCDSIEGLRGILRAGEREFADVAKFKDFYYFTFNYARNEGQKGLDLDAALAYWNICLHDRFRLLPLWCKYLTVSSELSLSKYLYFTINTFGQVEPTPRLWCKYLTVSTVLSLSKYLYFTINTFGQVEQTPRLWCKYLTVSSELSLSNITLHFRFIQPPFIFVKILFFSLSL